MGKLIDELWHDYQEKESNEMTALLVGIELAIKSFDVTDVQKNESIIEKLKDTLIEIKRLEKKAFSHGVAEGCKLMITKV